MTEKILKTSRCVVAKICRSVVALMALTGLFTTLSVDADAQLRYGFRFAGDIAKASLSKAGSSSVASSDPGNDLRLVNRSGFSGGLVLEYQFEKCGFAPDIALLYTRYNTRLALGDEKPHSLGRNFIEVPIHLKWKFWIPQTKNLFAPMLYTGPSLMFRAGQDKGLPDFRSKVFQPGWDAGIGFDVINFIQITAGYRFGLGNALDTPDGMTLHTNGWNIAATLLFDF